MNASLAWLLHAALILLAAPALDSVLRQVRAWRMGGAGPPLAQPWRDLVRLWRKPAMAPPRASFVFAAAPVISLAAAAAAALLVPSFTLGMATAGAADLIVVAGLLMVSRAAISLAAHDAAAAPVIIAGNRTLTARLGTEPLLLIVAMAAMLATGGTNIDAMAAAIRDGAPGLRLGGGLAGLALLGIAATEAAAPPIFSGRHLALVTAAAQIRLVATLSLAVATGFPAGMAPAGSGVLPWMAGLACWALKLLLVGAAATAIGPHRLIPAAAAMIALIAILVLAVQGVV